MSKEGDLPNTVFKSKTPDGAAKKAGTLLGAKTEGVEVTLRCNDTGKDYKYRVSQVDIPEDKQQVTFKQVDGSEKVQTFRTRTIAKAVK